MKRRWVAVLAAVLTCAACRSTPESLTLSLSSPDGPLVSAVRVAERLEDPVQRAEVLTTVGHGYLAGGNQADALRVATEAARLVDDTPLAIDLVARQLAVAELLLACDSTQRARALILETTTYLETLRDEVARARLLPAVIRTALMGDDDTRDLLPAAVDPVYIIEDTALRARAFIDIAQAYLEGGLSQSVTGLIQQAIPAIRSTPDPMRRALLFGDLSTKAASAGESRLAGSLAEDAEEEFLLAAATGTPDAATVASVYSALARERGAAGAMDSVAATLPTGVSGPAYLAIVSTGTGRLSERVALTRSVEIAHAIEDDGAAGTLLAGVAAQYLRLNLNDRAAEVSNLAASRIWASDPDAIDVAVHIRLAEVFALMDRTEELRQHLERISEPFVRGLISVSVAQVLIDTGRQGSADDFLVDALLAADDAGFLADSLREDVASGFSRSENFSLAIRTIERISDPPALARSVAMLALEAERTGGLSAEQLRDLNSVLGLEE